MSLSGSAGTAAVLVAGDVRVRVAAWPAGAACDVPAPDPLAGPVTNWITTGPWCWPHQSPTNTAPAPDATAKTHAPVMDAADARAFHVLTVAPHVRGAGRKKLEACTREIPHSAELKPHQPNVPEL